MVSQARAKQAQAQKSAKTAAPPAQPPRPVALGGAAGAGAGSAAALAASLTLAFATLAGVWLLAACKRILLAAGLSILIVTFLAGFAFTGLSVESPFETGPAEREQMRLAAAYRAWYIVNAVERLERAERQGPAELARAEELEARYFSLHLRAVNNRLASARAIDQAAKWYGPRLGWKAMMDGRTTAECRAANGKNFRADREPLIGWPGSVHPHCRCVPVAPFLGAPLLPSV